MSPTPSAAAAPAAARVRRFPCPQCGADVVWDPGAGQLACDYCGFRRAVHVEPESAIRERPLEEELARPRDLGWGMERKRYRCSKCGAIETLEPGVAASSCAFCGTPAVVEAPPRDDLVRPAGILPFRVERNDALRRFRSWLKSLWFRPNDLRKIAEVESIRGVYVPFWTFDAATFSRWSAESGRTVGSGKSRRTVWRPVSGTYERFFDDLPVPASRGLDGATSERLEPFPTAALVPFEPDYLAGFLAEEYARDLPQAFALAKTRMTQEISDGCRAQVPGKCRNLRVQTAWSALATKSALLPIWIAAYEYRGKSYAWVVNGVTGRTTGSAPWSWIKIVAAVLAVAVGWFLVRMIAG